jgi:DNA polymerase-3 subunit beta
MPTPTETTNQAKAANTLEFVVFRDTFLAELANLQGVVENKTTIPILSNILVTADSLTSLTLTATNLERSLRTTLHAKVKQTGAIAIPARKLFDFVKLLPSGDITIKAMDNGWVQIRAGRSNTKMVGMAPGNYPQIPNAEGIQPFKIPCASMRALIDHTEFAVSKEESRYALNAAQFTIEADQLKMVATNGHRLAYYVIPNKKDGINREKPSAFLIPHAALSGIRNLLHATDEADMTICSDDNSIFFTVGARKYATRKMSAQFPNVDSVLPQHKKYFIAKTADVEKAIRRVATFADDKSNAVKMTVDSTGLKFSARSTESGESEDAIDVPYTGEPVSIGFNSGYFLDFLQSLNGKGEFRLLLNNSQSAAELRPEGLEDGSTFRYVVMPCKVN